MGKHRLEDRELKESARPVVQTTTRRNPTAYYSALQENAEQPAVPVYPQPRPVQRRVAQPHPVAQRPARQQAPRQQAPRQVAPRQSAPAPHQPAPHQPTAYQPAPQHIAPQHTGHDATAKPPAAKPGSRPAAKPTAASAPSRKRRSHALSSMRRKKDDLYERSFKVCLRCGEDVYVLANSCRNCDG